MAYRYGPEWMELSPSEVATAADLRGVRGAHPRTAMHSTFPFHVTSRDWQESDRVLAAIISAFGQPTRAVPVGGSGEFDGVMTRLVHASARRPGVSAAIASARVERELGPRVRRRDDRQLVRRCRRAGDCARARRRPRRGPILARLSPPRRGRGDRRARAAARLAHRGPAAGLRAGRLPRRRPGCAASSTCATGTRTPQGFGRVTIRDIVAYGERFETGAARDALRGQRGSPRRHRGAQGRRGRSPAPRLSGGTGPTPSTRRAGGSRWNSVAALAFPAAPLSGQLQFTASRQRGVHLAALRGRAPRRRPVPSRRRHRPGQRAPAGPRRCGHDRSVRSGLGTAGRVGTRSRRPHRGGRRRDRPAVPGDVDRSLRARLPAAVSRPSRRRSPAGRCACSANCGTPERVRAEDVVVDRLALNLFDYRLRNDGDLRFSLDNQVVRMDRLRLVGDGTAVEMAGEVRLAERAHRAAGPRRRQPRDPPGLPARHPELGRRRAAGRHPGTARRADGPGRARHQQRTAPAFRVAARLREPSTAGWSSTPPVCAIDDLAGRLGRRARPRQRPSGVPGLHADRVQPDGGRRGDAPSLSRRGSGRSSTPPDAAWRLLQPAARGDRDRAQRHARAHVRHGRHRAVRLSARVARAGPPSPPVALSNPRALRRAPARAVGRCVSRTATPASCRARN